MVKKSFKENAIFFMKKDSNFNSRNIRTSVFRIGSVPIKQYGSKNTVFAIQHMKIEKVLLKCFPSPPPPRDQTNPFANSCGFTFDTSYKNGMIGHGGGERCQNAQKLFLIKTF